MPKVVKRLAVLLAILLAGSAAAGKPGKHDNKHNPPPAAVTSRTLDGAGNNDKHVSWGRAGTDYVRVGKPNFADGIAAPVSGPNSRLISNRIFNDNGQNLFSERNVSQWGWIWGQFIDHDMGLRDETPGENATIPFNRNDPLESFTNDLGGIGFSRTPASPGSGVSSPRQEVNTLTSYIDGSQIYGVTDSRDSWLRDGPHLLLPDGFLPRVDARGDAASAPQMDLMGPLMGDPGLARVAGDVRANENIALLSLQTLFAREHNRIVDGLPGTLSDDQKFEFARRTVGAEIEYITYNEFLPALGVNLDTYRGYKSKVNAGLSNEFATDGFRAHSMVHGQFDVPFEAGDYTAEQLDAFTKEGIAIGNEEGAQSLQIPLSVAFGHPDLLQEVGIDNFFAALNLERQYRNDEQIDNTMRSVLFEIPKPGTTDPAACQVPVVDPQCFSGVVDLAAIDIERGRDHGLPNYNQMRRAYGLKAKKSFTAITGEKTDSLGGLSINDPHILDFTELRDGAGNVIPPNETAVAQEDAVTGIRRTTVAARLKAIYGTVDTVDAFVGMSAESHVPGTEFGELQLAIWKDQFGRLRDGDQFFYAHDPVLTAMNYYLGVDYRHSLADIIQLNTDATVPSDVFISGG